MEKTIEILNKMGYQVVFIHELNKVFIVNEFETSSTIGGINTGFNRVKGIEISSLIQTLVVEQPLNTLKAKLEKFIEDSPVLNMKFSINYRWYMYL